MNQWERDQKEEILQNNPTCFLCNDRDSTQLHHAIVHDSKRHHREVTVPENLMPVCEVCHVSTEQKANGHEMAVKFANYQIEKGYDIVEWYKSLPLKIKEAWLLNL